MNYHGLADFRTAHPELLDRLLTENVASLSVAGVINLDEVAQDGVRVRASAGASSFRRSKKLHKELGEMEALAPLDLVVPQGSVFALVGHNGAGKTTLIKLLLNMMKPTSGEATVLGQSASTLEGKAFERIGYVSENQEMPEWMTVDGGSGWTICARFIRSGTTSICSRTWTCRRSERSSTFRAGCE